MEQTTLWPKGDFSIAFSIGNFDLPWYAIFFMIGFFVTIVIACITCHFRYKLKYDILFWFAILLVPASLLGARFWSACIGDLPWEDFFTRSGGLAIQGGVVASVIVAIIYFPLMLKKPTYHVRTIFEGKTCIAKPSMWIFLDIITPLVLLGQAIGRWGNFFNGELFGRQVDPSSLHWLEVIMPGVYDHMQAVVSGPAAEGLINGAYYEPLFLYEGLLNIFFFLIIYLLLPNFKQIKIGVIGSLYFVIYGIIRFSLEPLRFSAYTFIGTYVINGILMTLGIVLFILCQFVLPKYRHKQLLYMFYIKHIRIHFIRLGIKMKIKKAIEFTYKDKDLKNYGFEKPYSFLRAENAPIYYADR